MLGGFPASGSELKARFSARTFDTPFIPNLSLVCVKFAQTIGKEAINLGGVRQKRVRQCFRTLFLGTSHAFPLASFIITTVVLWAFLINTFMSNYVGM